MGNLRESRKGAAEGLFGYLTRQDTAKIVPPGESAKKADLFIAVNASTVELTDIEKYIEATVGDKPMIIWNMELGHPALRPGWAMSWLCIFPLVCSGIYWPNSLALTSSTFLIMGEMR